MAVPSSGSLSLFGIYKELTTNTYTTTYDGANNISIRLASIGTYSTINAANAATDRPDGSTPHAMSEFYNYDHDIWNGKIKFINVSDGSGGATVAHSTVCSNYNYTSFNSESAYNLTESDANKLINGTTGSELDFNSWNVSGSADTFAILIYNVGGNGQYLIAANINDDNEINSRTICTSGIP